MKNAAKFILIALSAAVIMAVFSACSQKTEEPCITLRAGNSTLLSWSGTSVVLYDVNADGTTEITAKNTTTHDESLTLYSADGSIIDIDAPAGEEASLTLEAEGLLSGGIAVGDRAYVTTAGALLTAAADGKTVTLVENISAEELVFTSPVKLYTGDYSLKAEKLGFEYAQSGTFSLSGNVSAEEIYAEAPLSKITVPEELAPEEPELCINCLIFNNVSLKDKAIDSEEKLASAAKNASEKSTVAVENFELKSDIIFTHPVKLVFRNVTGSGKIIIETDKAGEIEVLGLEPERLTVEAPDCSLVTDECNILEAAKLWNTRTVNGYNTAEIRDSGKASKISATLDGYKWTLRGGALRAKITGMLLPRTMESVQLSVSAPGYTVSYCDFCKNEDGTLNLLSREGVALRLEKAGAVTVVPIVTEFENVLPVVEINTADGKAIESKTDWKDATFSFDASFSDEDWEIIDGAECTVAGRGNSTWDWSFKKPYKIKLSEKRSVAGLTESKNWVLLANYMDKSLIRNYVALECAKLMDNCDSYASQYPVNLFLNGEYVGVYSIGEKVEEGGGRAFIREKAYSVDTGFILELNGSSDEESEDSTFGVSHLGPVTVQYPNLTLLSEKQLTFISNYMALASRAVIQKRGWQDYIDTDSLVDWYIITELSYNSDSCMRRSVFFEKDSGGKIVMGQPWDFDLAFGNSRGDGAYDQWAALVNTNYVKVNWMTYLMDDEEFYSALRARWNEKKDELLATALDTVKKGEEIVAPSAKYNFEKWDILYQQLSMEPYYAFEDNDSYEDYVDYLETFIKTRWAWIDEALNAETTTETGN